MIQVHLGGGVVVDGRIDLIRRLDTNEVAVVDFKSTERAQTKEVSRDQLHVYALGYEELVGEKPDLIEVLNLDEKGGSMREEVEAPLLAGVREKVIAAGQALRANDLPRHASWCEQCDGCDVADLCRPSATRKGRSMPAKL